MPLKALPMYRRTLALHAHADTLAQSVRVGKKAIAEHMEESRRPGFDVKLRGHEVDTTIAGVVRDRKTLKKLQYDQPY